MTDDAVLTWRDEMLAAWNDAPPPDRRHLLNGYEKAIEALLQRAANADDFCRVIEHYHVYRMLEDKLGA